MKRFSERDGASKRSRRRFLAATGVVGTGIIAGCLGVSDDGNGNGDGGNGSSGSNGNGMDDSVVRIRLNTDPNESADKVRGHAERNGFDWRFAVAPTEMTRALREEFGPTVVNAPSTPVIVACQGGSSTFMSGSQSSVSDIRGAADDC